MVTKKKIIVGLILAAIGAAIFLLFVDWDARAVKKHLRSLEKELVWTQGENELALAARIRHIQAMIAETCQVDIPTYEITKSISQNDVPAYLVMGRSRYTGLSVEFRDLKVEYIKVPAARAITTASIKATASDGQKRDEVLELEFALQKVKKEWQITDVKEIQVLSR